jgi:hypothetical protein
MMRSLGTLFLAMILAGVAAQPVPAASFDGSKDLLCAMNRAFECDHHECAPTTMEEVNVPGFVKVDFGNKRLSGTGPAGDEQTTAVESLIKRDGKTILQGAENARAWSVVIDQENGRLSATVADNEVGFVLFGACTTP